MVFGYGSKFEFALANSSNEIRDLFIDEFNNLNIFLQLRKKALQSFHMNNLRRLAIYLLHQI